MNPIKMCGPSFVFSALLCMALHTLTASAAPRSLGCQVNATDGHGPKTGQTMLDNTTGKVIPEGTVIELVVQVKTATGPASPVKTRFATFRRLEVHDNISAGDTPKNATGCTASISLFQPQKTITNKPPPKLSP
jgi:hypothetical protein